MKSWLAFVVAMLTVLSPAVAEKVAAMPAPTGYVDDYAGVLTPAGKAEVEGICREVHDKTKAQIFFVTVKSLEGESIETFANDLFHQWKIGEKKTDRGVLLLLAVQEHKRRIEVGYGLEGILPDAKAGDIGIKMVPLLRASNYDAAARIGVAAVADLIAADAKVSLTSTADGGPAVEDQAPQVVGAAPSSQQIQGGGKWIIAVMFLNFFGMFGLVAWMITRRVRRGFVGGGPGYYGSSGGTSFGGGDSGGSDSSSSDSFSGGDGGDSGGGGASGGW